jgi:amyloid beta precursor protein binding protein 1
MEGLTSETLFIFPPGAELPEDFEKSVGEVCAPSLFPPLFVSVIYHTSVLTNRRIRSIRAPTADLPNTAALLGGVVAQKVIKIITKQHIPINGPWIIDFIETWTGVL